jgi:hypothetical protein
LTNVFVGSSSSISPDGRRLLFASGKPGVQMLCDLPACTNMREVFVKSARWAPDGKGVVCVDEEDHANLWEQPLDGGPSYPLTRFTTGQILQFAWSADYKRLVLSRGRVSDDIVLLKGLR